MDLDIFNNFQRDLEDLQNFQDYINLEYLRKSSMVKKQQFCNGSSNDDGNDITSHARYFDPLRDMRDDEYRYSYRFSKENTKRIIEMVKDDLELDIQIKEGEISQNRVPVDKQIMTALRYWGMTEHAKITARIHGVSLRTLMKISKRVSKAISAKASRYIRMPCLLAEKEKVAADFYNLACMPQVIGAVAHATVNCRRFIGDKCQQEDNVAIHLQLVADANLKIRDLDCRFVHNNGGLTSWEIFIQSRIRERFEQQEFRGRLLLGNDTLKCTGFLYTPVTLAITQAEHAFNHALKLTYEPVKLCYKLWSERFGILNSGLCNSPSTTRHIIIALAVLHNLAIEWRDTTLEDFQNSLSDFGRNTIDARITDDRDSDRYRSRNEFIKNHFCKNSILTN